MKKVLICGMLLGLLPCLAFAQRGRAVGGMGPAAHMPKVGSTPSNVGVHPNSVGIGHSGVAPNSAPVGSDSKTAAPNATTSKVPDTVAPNATMSKVPDNAATNPKTVPDRVIPSDTGTVSPVIGVGPER